MTCFLILQFSVLSAVDAWAMSLPMQKGGPVQGMKMKQGAAGKVGMSHCQASGEDAMYGRCHCASCACIPLVLGAELAPFMPVVLPGEVFTGISARSQPGYALPPFRPPIG